MLQNKTYKIAVLKLATIVLVVAVAMGVPKAPLTKASFNDVENSTENVLGASLLDINISPANFAGTVFPGGATTTTITLSKLDPTDLDFQYFAHSTTTSSEALACDYITLSASSSAQNISGLLKDFVSATGTPTSAALWDFTFSVAPGAPTGTCNFKIVYTAWQTNLPDSSGGFSDMAEMTGSISIEPSAPAVVATGPDVVLNEFLPNPTGDDFANAPQGEWIEIYNNNPTTSFELNGWYVRDAANNNVNIELNNTYDFSTNASSTVIAPNGWLVVYMNKTFLNNSGTETITLYNGSGVAQDSYSYTASSVPTNKSYARIPDGTGSWVDPIPTPGGPNVLEESLIEIPVVSNIEVPLEPDIVEPKPVTTPVESEVIVEEPAVVASEPEVTPEPEVIGEVLDEVEPAKEPEPTPEPEPVTEVVSE